MKIPKLLLGATVIFWGSQMGVWFLAIPIAIILEASHWLDWRWELSADALKKIVNFCEVMLVSLVIYLLIINPSYYFTYELIKWLPLVCAPLLIAQAYSVSENIDLRTLFFWYKPDQTTQAQAKIINLNYPYFFLCILSAAAANTRHLSFYLGVLVISAVILWSVRSPRFTPLFWLTLLLVAGGLGFIGQIGLHQLHLITENQIVEWLSGVSADMIDPFQKQTNIGAIGQLKLSNEIVFRVKGEATPPRLLREATYNQYESSTWLAFKSRFEAIAPTQNNLTTWQLAPLPTAYQTITISAKLSEENNVLRLPDGTFQINQLPVNQMAQNQYGTVQVSGKEGMIIYQIQFNDSLALNSPPTPEDLEVPPTEKAAVDLVIKQLDLQGKSEQQILDNIERFFLGNFQYSLNLATNDSEMPALSTFLLKTRSGHCEYFASATTLLLRSIGIPARYAVGYSVHEFSPWENQYIVRKRHGHAWTLAYIGGKWQAFDTTPGDWTSQEDQMVSKLGFINDLWSLITFQFALWLKQSSKDQLVFVGGLIGIILLVIWQWQGKGKKRGLLKLKKRNQVIRQKDIAMPQSDFYVIEQELNKLGFVRHAGESWKSWCDRLQREAPQLLMLPNLASLIELYYRDRFDPQGISNTEKEHLKSALRDLHKML